MAPQAYKKPPQAPPLFTGTPKSVIEDTQRIIDQSRSTEDKIVANVKPQDATFEKVMLPMAYDENDGGLETHIIGFYQSVSTDQELRDASTKAEEMMDEFAIESSMREDVYGLVKATLEKGEKLDPESERLLEKANKDYIRNGLGLPAGPKRDRFKEIKKRLSQLSIVFSKNLNEEVGGIWFTEEELAGVPEDVVGLFAKGEGENAGKVKMTFKYPDILPTTKYAKNAATRKTAYLGNENKLPQNIPIFREVILLRDEAARLLGYPNHAAFIIEDKMAKTPEWVDNFLGDLRKRLSKGGDKERKALTELKKQELESIGKADSFDGRYYIWDNRYYDRLMLEKDYSLDQEKLSEWFPLETSIRGMLTIFETLFGMTFVEVTGDDRAAISPSGKGDDIVWHPEVQMFSVWDSQDQGSSFVGYLYLDLHPREGKYGHAANFNLQPGFIQPNGTRRYPVTALVCNFSKPTAKKPSLLKHSEVTTLFHELGHGIHDLVAKTHYSRFHGTNVVRDFVEAPSQMLENWCWTPSQLKALSYHYSWLTPEYEAAWREQAGKVAAKPEQQLPDKMIEDLIKTKHVNDAMFNLRQLHFGIFDMTVHEPKSHVEVESFRFSEMYNKIGYDLTKLDSPAQLGEGWEWGHGETTFGHLIGGYDAGYYGYLASQVYSMDMFYSVFEKNPMDGKEGRRYRHQVLEKGGSQDEMETLKGFLGREPNGDAFYKELGLA
ncbi:hypothetical protein MMC21_005646 [Puttea exsequens]|nr:hypothetical protein [Puttea exsequens]